jgi:hypothetical protein
MSRRVIDHTKTLTDKQKYLLQRLPNTYQLDGFKTTHRANRGQDGSPHNRALEHADGTA